MLVDAGITKDDLLDQLGLKANLIEELCELPENFFNTLPTDNNLITFRGSSKGKRTFKNTESQQGTVFNFAAKK